MTPPFTLSGNMKSALVFPQNLISPSDEAKICAKFVDTVRFNTLEENRPVPVKL